MREPIDQAALIYRFFEENEQALLIILDACNWKVLASLKPDWKMDAVWSRGSCTSEWLQNSFQKPLKDVVYVSSNPYTFELKEVRKKFKRVVDLYLLCWDDKLLTVHPRNVNLFVKENIIAGEKKLIAHYMQPHPPFIVNTWLNLYAHDIRKNRKVLRIYDLARKESKARNEFVRAYINNLSVVTHYVDLLTKNVRSIKKNFQIVVTSDHSEVLKSTYNPHNKFRKKIWLWIPWLLGIYRFIGHESESKLKELYKVPWVVL